MIIIYNFVKLISIYLKFSLLSELLSKAPEVRLPFPSLIYSKKVQKNLLPQPRAKLLNDHKKTSNCFAAAAFAGHNG